MYADTVQNLAEAGAAKLRRFAQNPSGFMMFAAMAGMHVGSGILLTFSLGSALEPAQMALVMGASFGLALIPIVSARPERCTGSAIAGAVSKKAADRATSRPVRTGVLASQPAE